jgi:hypothetical protein
VRQGREIAARRQRKAMRSSFGFGYERDGYLSVARGLEAAKSNSHLGSAGAEKGPLDGSGIAISGCSKPM